MSFFILKINPLVQYFSNVTLFYLPVAELLSGKNDFRKMSSFTQAFLINYTKVGKKQKLKFKFFETKK